MGDISGGGWAVFQYRFQGTTDFARSWKMYENGFGDLNAEFWLGLKNLNKLTSEGAYDLRVQMTSYNGITKYAEYKHFKIADASDNYRISFKKKSHSGTAADALEWHNNQEFSTKDFDNDASDGANCAAIYGGGGNWYAWCYNQKINGQYGRAGDRGGKFMSWSGVGD